MKRKEMEKKIQSVIEDFFHNEDPKYGFLAEYILEEVEKDMQPTGYIIDGNSFCWEEGEWEPEDE